jgi:hypothetical protein
MPDTPLTDHDYARALASLQSKSFQSNELQYAEHFTQLLLLHPTMRTKHELDFTSRFRSYHTFATMMMKREVVRSFPAGSLAVMDFKKEDLRLSVVYEGGFTPEVAVALVVQQGAEMWVIFEADGRLTVDEAWKAFGEKLRVNVEPMVRGLLREAGDAEVGSAGG